MRLLIVPPLLALAGCSGESEPVKNETQAVAVEQFSPGQWEMTTEVTQVVKRDAGPPAIAMAQGSRSTRSVCIGEAEGKQPPPALFMPDGFDCKYRDAYVRGGRLNTTLACTRTGLSGDIATNVNGRFTAETFEGTATTETSIAGSGDVRIDTTLTGRRTGTCSAAPQAS